jgi:GNAT superfamily N-acetyltransferase
MRAVRSRFVAQRDVPQGVSRRQIEEEVPLSWKKDEMLYGYVSRYMLKGSGAGFVTPPYTAYWDRIWGATPIEDFPKYKDLYTFTSYIKAAIDVTVNLAISNGFELNGGDNDVRQWLSDWLDEQNILQTLRIVASDMLVFGNAFIEICRDETSDEVTWLKPLDPVHMRVRHNEYGDIFGYIQLLTFPPVVFEAQDMVHFRWGAKSWWYESSYGTSLLRPLLKVQALLDQLEDDLAVIVYSYPPPSCYGRRLVLPRITIQEMNKQLSIISRVVIHPKYRTVGLGAKLIRETLPLAGTSYVEMIAVMAKYNPFAEKAGMQKIVEQQKVESVSDLSKVLLELGFDLQLLGSEHYVKGRLESLSSEQIDELKGVFIRNKHPRFKKEFAVSRHQPFGKTSDYIACIENADHVKIAKLVKLVGMLLQTKVYLFWKGQ